MTHRTKAELEEERQLIERAKHDQGAFGELYERYIDQIHNYVHSLTRSRDTADDVTAATFARAMEELPRFEWRGVPYSAWLYRVASNLVARHRRRPQWIELSTELPANDEGPAELSARLERAREMRAAVDELPRDQRQAVLLRFGGDLRHREVAELMGRTEGAVKLLTFRALTTLRRRLGAPQPSERTEERTGTGTGA